MKKMSRLGLMWGWLSILAMLVGCTTAKPVAEWRDANYQGGPFNNFLIVGVAGQESIRRTFEETFVNRLRDEQVNAIAGFEAIPGEARPSKDSIKAAIEEKDIDAVLITHLVGVDEKQIYHPPTYSGGVYGYYGGCSRVRLRARVCQQTKNGKTGNQSVRCIERKADLVHAVGNR